MWSIAAGIAVWYSLVYVGPWVQASLSTEKKKVIKYRIRTK